MDKIKFPVREQDQIRPIMRIFDRSGWHESAWVHDVFKLYYILQDLGQIDRPTKTRYVKKIESSLNKSIILYNQSESIIKNMHKYRADFDNQYCASHEITMVSKTPMETKWENSVIEYQGKLEPIYQMNRLNWNSCQLSDVDVSLANTICHASTIGHGSELYETLSLIDILHDGSLIKQYYQNMRNGR